MAIEGKGTAKRKSSMIFMNVGTSSEAEYEVIGKGIEELSREMNNEVESNSDILGNIDVSVTKGAQVTSVDPLKFNKESKISKKMYDIYKYDKELSDVEEEFIEVFTEDKITEGEFAAFKQMGAIDLKSWGGPTKSLDTPFDINWAGEKVHGAFNPSTKIFTPEA